MYIGTCLAYNEIKVIVDALDSHINLKVEDDKTGNSFSMTLSSPQAATLVKALLEILINAVEPVSPTDIFGKATLVRKEAA